MMAELITVFYDELLMVGFNRIDNLIIYDNFHITNQGR